MKTKFITSIAAFWLTMCGANAQTFSQREIYDFEVGDIFQYHSIYYDNQHGLRDAHNIQWITRKQLSPQRDTIFYEMCALQIHTPFLEFTNPEDIDVPYQQSQLYIQLFYTQLDSLLPAVVHTYASEDCSDTILTARLLTPSTLTTYAKHCGILHSRSEDFIYYQLVAYRKQKQADAIACGCERYDEQTDYFTQQAELIWRSILGLPIYDL